MRALSKKIFEQVSVISVMLVFSIFGLFPFNENYGLKTVEAATTQTFTTSSSWVAPTDVFNVTVEAWGGGGAGGGRTTNGQGGGGGGGAYASADVAVIPGNSYSYTVGAATVGGSANGPAGNLSQWATGAAVRAAGGAGGLGTTTGGAGGTVANSVGTIRYQGGNGANAPTTISGGGGGGAGTTGAGGNAVNGVAGTGTTVGGGAGGTGVTNANGGAGVIAGGGGAGGRRTSGTRLGGNGAGGQIRITYAVISVTVSTGTVSYGIVPAGANKDTTSSGVNNTQVATNSGDGPEDFNIRGQNSANWTLSGTAGNETYVHAFCTTGSGSPDPCDTSPTWTNLTTSYQSLGTNIAVSGTRRFDLRITMPTSTAIGSQQSVDVVIQAVEN